MEREPLRALVLEDSEDDALLVVRELRQQGFEVKWERAWTTPATKSLLSDQKWDVVLSDYHMPGFGAPAALQLLHETGLDIPFIVISGTVGEEAAVAAMKDGAHDYLMKGNLARLGAAIEREIKDAGVRREHRLAIDKIKHLNRVLRAIRNVNKLIVTEKNPERLLERATEMLVETRGYTSALCVHLDDNQQPDIVSHSVAGRESTRVSLDTFRSHGLTPCMKQALKTNEVVVLTSDAPECSGCPLGSYYPDKRRLAKGLVHDGKACGVLVIVLPEEVRPDAEELDLLEEMAGDIAFALHGMHVDSLHAESQERFRIITESSPDAIFTRDQTGNYTYVNSAASKLLGYSAEELTKMTIVDITLEGQHEKTLQIFQKSLAEGSVFAEIDLVRKDGTVVPVDLNSVILPNGQVYAICRDISERKRAEEAQRESAELFLAVFQQSAMGKALASCDGHFLRVNDALASMLGYRTDEIEGRSFAEFTHPDDVAISREAMSAILAGAATQRFVKRYLRKDGGLVWADISLSAIRDTTGQTLHFVVGVLDITERMRVVGELQEAKELVDAIVENVPLMIFLKEAQDLKFVVFNKAGEELLGHDRKDLLGKNNLDLFPPEQAAFFMAKDQEVLDGETLVDIPEEPIQTAKKGERLLHTRKLCIRGADGKTKYLLGISEDITERKRAQEAHDKLEEQLRASQKMEAIGSLAGGVAHDFNNLLTVILSYTGFAMGGLRDGDPLKDDLLEVKKAGEHAAALTRQLLAFSRKQVLQPVALDLNQIAAGVEKMLRRILGEDIDFVQKLAPDLGLIMADPGQIEQVLMNLVVNGRDAMPQGGRLTIETSNVEIDEEYAALHVAVTPGSYVQLAVSDTGCGMDEQTRARIFEPFFTTKEKGKGTGLGLSTVYGIVTQSGGSIWVYSELGQGTAFKVVLPRDLSATTATDIKPSIIPRLLRGTETILVVEDEEALRKVVLRTLGAAGYTVLTAGNGEEALARSAQYNGDIHLLVTDVVMPKMGGRVLAQELSKKRPTIKVLFMSGYTDDTITHHGMLDPGTHFLAKPFTSTAVAQKVREVLDGGITRLAE